jgi:hypothetical protein
MSMSNDDKTKRTNGTNARTGAGSDSEARIHNVTDKTSGRDDQPDGTPSLRRRRRYSGRRGDADDRPAYNVGRVTDGGGENVTVVYLLTMFRVVKFIYSY